MVVRPSKLDQGTSLQNFLREKSNDKHCGRLTIVCFQISILIFVFVQNSQGKIVELLWISSNAVVSVCVGMESEEGTGRGEVSSVRMYLISVMSRLFR